MLSDYSLEDIKMLENIIKSICVSYRKLYDYENKGLKNTDEYKKEIDNLKNSIGLEDQVLERIDSSEEFEKIINYLENKYGLKVGINITTIGDEKESINARIANSLFELQVKRATKTISKDNFSGMVYVSALYQDIVNLALAIFYENKMLNESEKIKIKYKLSMGVRNIERGLINNNFEIISHPFISSNLLLINDVEVSCAEFIKDSECGKILMVGINDLVKEPDEFNINKLGTLIFNSSLLRAAFVLVSDKIFEKTKVELNVLLDNLKEVPDYKIAYNILNQIINSRENDKNIPQYITFGR